MPDTPDLDEEALFIAYDLAHSEDSSFTAWRQFTRPLLPSNTYFVESLRMYGRFIDWKVEHMGLSSFKIIPTRFLN